MRAQRLFRAMAILLLGACAGDTAAPGGSGGAGGAGGAGGGGNGGGNGGGGSAGNGGSGSGGSGGAAGAGGAGGAATGCKRLDLVFAVDDSSSMQEEQKEMNTVIFPAFATRLLSIKGVEEFRAATVDACPRPADFHTRGESGECMFSSGKRWMESSSPKLVSEFACVGAIWSGDTMCSGNNDDEQPASAAAASLEPPASAAGGPNDGFLRSDAVLVVVAITDEDEQPTPNKTAMEVYDRLINVKGGDVKRMVFLGIGGASKCDGAYGSAIEAKKLKELTALFEAQGRGVFWDLCAGKLEDGLEKAIMVISRACEDVPPGGYGGSGGGGPPPPPSCPTGVTPCGPGGVEPGSCPAGTVCKDGCCLPWVP